MYRILFICLITVFSLTQAHAIQIIDSCGDHEDPYEPPHSITCALPGTCTPEHLSNFPNLHTGPKSDGTTTKYFGDSYFSINCDSGGGGFSSNCYASIYCAGSNTASGIGSRTYQRCWSQNNTLICEGRHYPFAYPGSHPVTRIECNL